MEYLVDLWFAPLRFWAVCTPRTETRKPEGFVIHLSASRKWRRRMKIIRRSR
jgi:hypothetical protein